MSERTIPDIIASAQDTLARIEIRMAALERAAEVLKTVEGTVFDQPLNKPARTTWTINWDLGCDILDALDALDTEDGTE